MWFLQNSARGAAINDVAAAYRIPIQSLDDNLDRILSPSLRETRDQKASSYIERKVPEALAYRIANLDALAPACDIARIAAGGEFEPTSVAEVYYGLGARFGFDWVRTTAEGLVDGDEWRTSAAYGIVEDLYTYQTELTTKLMDAAGGAAAAPAIIDVWSDSHRHAVERVTNMVAELKSAPGVDIAMLSVVNRELRALVSA
jgi:glutamate dehydrogenase